MRVLAVLAVLVLLAGGLAFAAATTLPAKEAPAPGPAKEVEAVALLDRAREEVAAYGRDWALVTVGAREQAEASHQDFASGPPDPDIGNGLATAWHFVFSGPDGMAFVALKADGTRSGLGWSEGRPLEPMPALPAWKVGSAAALATAREDPDLARFLDQDGLALSLQLAMRSDSGAPEPWWNVHASRQVRHEAPVHETGDRSWAPQESLSFRVHALDGRLQRDPQGTDAAQPVPATPPEQHPLEPCCPEERRASYGGSVDLFNPSSRNTLDAPPWAGSEGRFVLSWTSGVEGVPGALQLRVLGPDFEPVAVAEGKSPLRLAAADLPAGPLFAEVRAAEGEVAVSATYDLHMTLLVPAPPEPVGWEEQWWFGGGSPLERGRTHYLPLGQEAVSLRALLLTWGGPGQLRPTFEVTLLDAEGNALAYADGGDGTLLEAEALPAGEYWLEVVPLTAPGLAGPNFGGYGLEVRALHPFQVHTMEHGPY